VAPEGTSEKVDGFAEEAKTAADDLADASAALDDAAVKINTATDDIVKKDPEGVMKPEVATIKTQTVRVTDEADNIAQLSLGLYRAREELGVATQQVRQLEVAVESRDEAIDYHKAEVAAREEALAELEEKHKKALQRMLMYAIMAGLVCIAASAMLVVNGNGKAMGIGIGGAVLSITALAVSFFMANLALIGAIGVEQRRDKKAQFELVKTVEKIKSSFDEEGKEVLFGDLVGDGEVGSLQSEATKKIVRENRERLANEIRPTIR
jgi:hypothetical protein